MRELRKILEINQKTLSERTDISVHAIRSLENGRNKKLSAQTLDRLVMAFGGIWNGKKWVIGTRFMISDIPLTKAFADGFYALQSTAPTPEEQQTEVDLIQLRTRKLFDSIPRRHWSKLVLRFSDFLESCRQELAPGEKQLKAVFDDTRMHPRFLIDQQTGQTVSVERAYPRKSELLLEKYRRSIATTLTDTETKPAQTRQSLTQSPIGK